jgi:hypothetical protein
MPRRIANVDRVLAEQPIEATRAAVRLDVARRATHRRTKIHGFGMTDFGELVHVDIYRLGQRPGTRTPWRTTEGGDGSSSADGGNDMPTPGTADVSDQPSHAHRPLHGRSIHNGTRSRSPHGLDGGMTMLGAVEDARSGLATGDGKAAWPFPGP